jgi:hypothetical protein
MMGSVELVLKVGRGMYGKSTTIDTLAKYADRELLASIISNTYKKHNLIDAELLVEKVLSENSEETRVKLLQSVYHKAFKGKVS